MIIMLMGGWLGGRENGTEGKTEEVATTPGLCAVGFGVVAVVEVVFFGRGEATGRRSMPIRIDIWDWIFGSGEDEAVIYR